MKTVAVSSHEAQEYLQERLASREKVYIGTKRSSFEMFVASSGECILRRTEREGQDYNGVGMPIKDGWALTEGECGLILIVEDARTNFPFAFNPIRQIDNLSF